MVDPRRLSLPLLVTALLLLAATPAHAAVLFSDSLTAATEGDLITNEYAHWNPGLGVESPRWDMTSGSLFAGGWTGVPDSCAPNRMSSNCTNSTVFRLNTKRFDFGSVRVDALLRGNGWAVTPGVDWDGVHLWLRYRSEESLYYASIARRDGKVLVKKKCPGGPSNGGTYYQLGTSASLPLPLGGWRAVGASIDTAADGSVVIEVFRDGARVLTAVDAGNGCAPITAPGAVGVRGDNLDFNVRDFTVTELHPAPGQGSGAAPAPPAAPGAAPPSGAAPAPGPTPAPGQGTPPAGPSNGERRPQLAWGKVSRRFRKSLRVRVRAGRKVRRVTLHLGRRRVATDRRAPFRLRARPPRRLRRGVHRLRVTAYDRRGRRMARRTVRVRYLGRR